MSVPITSATENTWINSDNARSFGGDLDAVWIGDRGAVMPTGMEVPANHKNVGWLSDDGMELSFDDNVETFNGHQGGKVIRKKVTSSESSFTFTAAETTLLTLGLVHDIKETTKEGGNIRLKVSGGKKANDRRSWVVDSWDGEIFYRYLIPSGELGERPSISLSNSELTLYEQTVTVYGGFEIITNDPAVVGDEDGEG